MPKKKKRPSQATSEFLLPQPSAEGVRKLRALYAERTGEQIAEEDARRVLSKIMRFQYMNILINSEHDLREKAKSGAATAEGSGSGDETITREPGEAAKDAGGEGRVGRARGLLRDPG